MNIFVILLALSIGCIISSTETPNVSNKKTLESIVPTTQVEYQPYYPPPGELPMPIMGPIPSPPTDKPIPSPPKPLPKSKPN